MPASTFAWAFSAVGIVATEYSAWLQLLLAVHVLTGTIAGHDRSGTAAEPATPDVEADRAGRGTVVTDTCAVVCVVRNTTKQSGRANINEVFKKSASGRAFTVRLRPHIRISNAQITGNRVSRVKFISCKTRSNYPGSSSCS
jgi:hypothetical protein